MNKKDTVKIGLIGFGMAGQVFHAPIIKAVKGLSLKAIQTSNSSNIAIAQERFPETEIISDTSTLLADEEIDLIVVATPNHTHYELTKAALKARKNVVVDKPFTVNSTEADELVKLAESRGVLLSVHQNRRWDSDFLTVRKVLEKKWLGRLVEAEIHYDRYRPTFRGNTWKEEPLPGTGILYDLGSHLIDQALTLFGMPESLSADIRIQRIGGEIPDSFHIILYYQDLKVTLCGGLLVREPLPHYILLGEKGSFVKYGMDVQEEILKTGAKPQDDANWGAEPEELWGKINTEIDGLHVVGKIESEAGDYRKYYENVRDALLHNAPLNVTAAQAANTMKIIDLAIQSNEEKRNVQIVD